MNNYLLIFVLHSTLLLKANARQLGRAATSTCSLSSLLWRKPPILELEGCSIQDEALGILDRQGLIDELRRSGSLKWKVSKVARTMNNLYEVNNFFSSRVANYEISEDGSCLKLKCIEEGVPECNFKFFIRDDEAGKDIDVSTMELIQSSSDHMPVGRFREERNGALKSALFAGSRTLVQFNTDVFKSLQNSGLWKNLEYALWRSRDGQYHLHCFAEAPGVTRRIDYTVNNILSKEGAQLRFSLRNLDLMGTKLLAELSATLGAKDWYKTPKNHKLNVSVTYDTLRKAMWSDSVGNTMAITVASKLSLQDLLHILGLRKNDTDKATAKPMISTTFFLNSWHNKCKVQVAADPETLHLKSSRQSFNFALGNRPVATQHNIAIRAPIDAVLKREANWHEKTSISCDHSVSTRLLDKEATLRLKLGSNADTNEFRGTTPKLEDIYIILGGELLQKVKELKPWVSIKPGLFLDILCTINRTNSGKVEPKVSYSAGVMVKVIGIGISLALSEIPKNMSHGLSSLLIALKKSFYVSNT